MRSSVLMIAIIALTAACSAIRVVTDYDSNADFDSYKTFEIAPSQEGLPDEPEINELNGERVINAIKRELTNRGYREEADANIAVNIYVKVENKTSVTRSDGPYFPYYGRFRYYGYWGYYNYWGAGWGYSNVYEKKYKEGTMVIDMVDTETKKLIWQGVASGALSQLKRNPEKKINETIERLFLKYPLNPK